MADRHETVADIIAEKRREANYIVQVALGKCLTRRDRAEDEARDIRREADRLDAAHRRELDALNEQITDLRQQRDLWSKRAAELVEKCNEQYAKQKQVGNAAKLREVISTLRTALKEIRNDVLDMVMNYKSEDPDSYAHGLCLSIGGACDMALNSTKEFDNGNE